MTDENEFKPPSTQYEFEGFVKHPQYAESENLMKRFREKYPNNDDYHDALQKTPKYKEILANYKHNHEKQRNFVILQKLGEQLASNSKQIKENISELYSPPEYVGGKHKKQKRKMTKYKKQKRRMTKKRN